MVKKSFILTIANDIEVVKTKTSFLFFFIKVFL